MMIIGLIGLLLNVQVKIFHEYSGRIPVKQDIEIIQKEKVEDNKWVIRSRKSKKDRRYNG